VDLVCQDIITLINCINQTLCYAGVYKPCVVCVCLVPVSGLCLALFASVSASESVPVSVSGSVSPPESSLCASRSLNMKSGRCVTVKWQVGGI